MAIVAVNEIFEERTARWSATEGRQYTRVFRVLSNSIYDGPNTAIQAVGINRGDPYSVVSLIESDPNSYCTNISAVQEEGDQLGYLVTVEYTWYNPNYAGGGPSQNPLLIPIDVTWSFRAQEKVAEYDINGNPILNTASDPFDPPLVKDDPRPQLTVVRNEAVYNLSQAYSYRNAINSDSFATFDPTMARVIQIGSKSAWHQDCGWYWVVTYEFEFAPPSGPGDPGGYNPLVLNQGMRKISQSTNLPVPIVLNGVPVSKPMRLTKQGYLCKPSDPTYWLQFQIYPALPFGVFGFDPVALAGQRSGFNTGFGDQNFND
jgi:hypothetical protein